MTVKAQMGLLVQLQEKDRALDHLRQGIKEGPQRIQEIERQVRILEEDLEADKERIQEIEKHQRHYEAEVEDGLQHINKSKSRLLTAKNNKEYRALLKEIEDGEKANREKEDQILSCMEEADSLRKVLKDKEAALAFQRGKFEDEKKTIETRMSEDEEQLSEAERGKADLVQAIDPELLAKYEHIRTINGGLAVVLVEKATCLGCHLNIPPQMYNELQRGDSLKFCPNCERIIYWKDRAVGQEGDMSE